jgi:hypothetical protein
MAVAVKNSLFVLFALLFMGRMTSVQATPAEPLQSRQEQSSKSSWFYNTLAINYVTLNAIDLATTFHGLKNGAHEVNPIARAFIRNKPLAVAVKAGATVTVLYALSKARQQNKKVAYIALGTLNILYGLVVTNNLSVTMNLN